MKNIIQKLCYIFILSAVLNFQTNAQALIPDSTIQKTKKWSYLIELYLMFPNMNGTTGVSDLPEVKVDASSNDIFNHLQTGVMLYLEASNDKWSVNSDLIYMDLKQDVKSGTIINSGDVNAKQFAWEPAGLRKVLPWLEVGAGVIVNSVKMNVGIDLNNIGSGTTNKSAEVSQTWLDPMIIARIQSKKDKKFIYQLRGEIGGFGIGSDLAWQAQAFAGYRFSNLFHVAAGYRFISLDYETGSGKDKFVYNIDTSGPEIRLGITF